MKGLKKEPMIRRGIMNDGWTHGEGHVGSMKLKIVIAGLAVEPHPWRFYFAGPEYRKYFIDITCGR